MARILFVIDLKILLNFLKQSSKLSKYPQKIYQKAQTEFIIDLDELNQS